VLNLPSLSSSAGHHYSPPAAAHQPEQADYSISPTTNHSVQNAARRLLAAASSDGLTVEAGPRRADQPPRMRSSIACARCRRSKVKCVNSGIGTTCQACETTGRECTYPQPSAGGGGGGARRDSGENKQGPDSTTNNDVSRIYINHLNSLRRRVCYQIIPKKLF
jgi:hypothetical protein